MKIRRGVVAVVMLLQAVALAESPLEAVKAFRQACVAKETGAAMQMIVGTPQAGEVEDAYFQQKVRKLIENTGAADAPMEPVAEKSEKDLAVVTVVRTGKGGRKETDPMYLKQVEGKWRIIPFSNWRKLSFTAGEKKSLEELEKWYDAEEASRRAKDGAGDGDLPGG
jgi:hypothetical protein